MSAQRAIMSRPLWALLFIIFALLLDQASKIWVDTNLPLEEAVPVMPFLAAFRTYNTGVAFSMFDSSSGWFIVGSRLVIVALVLWLWIRTDKQRSLYHWGFALVVAGAAGNLLDRFLYGHVIDFVLFHTQSWSFAVFNLADSYITIGACLIVLEELFNSGKTKSADTD